MSAGQQLWAHHAGDVELVDNWGDGIVLEIRGASSYLADTDDRGGILVTRDELAELVRYAIAAGIVPTARTRAPEPHVSGEAGR